MDLAIQAGGAALGYPGLGRVGALAYRQYKKRRYNSQPGPSTPGMEADSFQRRGNPSAFGGIYHGKFSGPVKRPRKSGIYHGFKEKVLYSNVSEQNKCWYLNISSLPYATDPDGTASESDSYTNRVLVDICASIIREFYRKHHVGRIDLVSPDDQPKYYLSFTVDSSSVQEEWLNLVFMQTDGGATVNQDFVVFEGTTSYTLLGLARTMAYHIWTKWKSGYIPMMLSCTDTAGGAGTRVGYRGTMNLHQMLVSADVWTKVLLHNVTHSDTSVIQDNPEGTADVYTAPDSITNVNADPLRGKLYYNKRLCPQPKTGIMLGTTTAPTGSVQEDEWFMNSMRFPQTYGVRNIWLPSPSDPTIAAAGAPTGCWVTVPKPDYFKYCTGVKDVTLEPGVMKSFNVEFHFQGYLTTFLEKLANQFHGSSMSSVYDNLSTKTAFGNCVLVALEKRMRYDSATSDPIKIAYQVETFISTDIKSKRQPMTYHVETNY